MNAIIQSSLLDKKIYTAFIIAVGVTLFLFFIDEGYYNFNWMKDAANWFAFIIYVTLLFVPQLLLIVFLLPRKNNQGVLVLKYIAGVILGIASAFLLLS
jgi:hypothetical protein